MRAGAEGLTLLSHPLNFHLLRALAAAPQPLGELRRGAGSPPATTIRRGLDTLIDRGIVVRRRRVGFPATVDYELGRAGRELLEVAAVLRAWLAAGPGAPGGAADLGTETAKRLVKALVEGWSTTIVRALAARPLSLTELSGLIPALNYPSLERRLGALRTAGLIEPCAGVGRHRPCAATDWLRLSVAPLGASAAWERRHGLGGKPVGGIDVEAVLLLAAPALRLPAGLDGRVRVAVDLGGGRDRPAGAVAAVAGGRVVSCVTRLGGPADAWASGRPGAWFEAVAGELGGLEVGGDVDLAVGLLTGLRLAPHSRTMVTKQSPNTVDKT
jgi:DNA-binding HxlR family transcriptional regulator